jgi:hypothetical protein
LISSLNKQVTSDTPHSSKPASQHHQPTTGSLVNENKKMDISSDLHKPNEIAASNVVLRSALHNSTNTTASATGGVVHRSTNGHVNGANEHNGHHSNGLSNLAPTPNSKANDRKTKAKSGIKSL